MTLEERTDWLIQKLKDQTTRDIVAEERCMDCCQEIMDEEDEEVMALACKRFNVPNVGYLDSQLLLVDAIQKTITKEDIEAMEKQMQEEDDREELEEALPKLIEGLTWNLSENFRGLSVTEFAGICGEITGAAEEILNKYDHDIARLIVRAMEQALTADSILLERKCNEEEA